jgi:hypothetical protein
MRLQSLFGFANKRRVWQQGSTLRASLSESSKGYRQQRTMVHVRHRHAVGITNVALSLQALQLGWVGLASGVVGT